MEFQSPSWDNSSKIGKPLQQVPSGYIYLKPKATMSYYNDSLQETLLRKNSWDWSINTGQTCWFNNKLKDKIKEVSNVCTTSSHWVTNGEKMSEDSSHGLVVIQGTHVSQHHHSFLTKNQKHIQDSDICIWICGQTFVRLQWWI